MKKQDLFKKIPLPIPSSYGSEGTLRHYNYKIVDFLLQHFNTNWFDKDDNIKWRMVTQLKWSDVVSYYDQHKKPGA